MTERTNELAVRATMKVIDKKVITEKPSDNKVLITGLVSVVEGTVLGPKVVESTSWSREVTLLNGCERGVVDSHLLGASDVQLSIEDLIPDTNKTYEKDKKSIDRSIGNTWNLFIFTEGALAAALGIIVTSFYIL